jgi:hypothetical protein
MKVEFFIYFEYLETIKLWRAEIVGRNRYGFGRTKEEALQEAFEDGGDSEINFFT